MDSSTTSSRLTNTTSQLVFPVVRPNNNLVTLTFDTDPSRPGVILFTLPERSSWRPGPHWHESYTEFVKVVQGRAKVVLNGVSKIVTADDGPQVIDKYVVHEWMRADRDSEEKDEGEVVVEEWTDPADGIKQVFFRNLFGVVTDMKSYWRSWTVVQLLLISVTYDNYVVFAPPSLAPPTWISYFVAHAVSVSVRVTSKIMGLKPWYPEYTPARLRNDAASGAVELPLQV